MIWVALILAASCLYAQYAHNSFKREQMAWKDNLKLAGLLDERLKDLEDIKSKVEALVIRVGFNTRPIK